jgi:TolB-like protein
LVVCFIFAGFQKEVFMEGILRKLITAFFTLNLTAGLYAQTRLADPNDPNATARGGQAEIIINASNADRDIAVWINGAIAAHVRPKTREKIVVRNGQNLIEAADTTAKGGQWNIGSKKQITVNSNSDCVTIGITTRYGALLNLSVQNTTALGSGGAVAPAVVATPAPARTSSPPPPRPAAGEGSIENAVYRAADVIIASIPSGSTLAVLSIATNDSDLADFVIEELAYLMVETRKFKVVDRKSLDAVRTEARFQYSGDVDDNSAVSIGKLLGASIVITGSVSGSGSTRRLRAKALNVQTAEIMAMASERY